MPCIRQRGFTESASRWFPRSSHLYCRSLHYGRSFAIGILPFLLFFGGFSLPLGLPPLPEDPVISRVAPEECLAYMSWAGTATPDAKSTNQTEQLLAEPEVQKLLSAIDSAMTTGIKKRGPARRPSDAAVSQGRLSLGQDVADASRGGLPVEGGNRPPRPRGPGRAIFNLAEKTASVSESLDRLEKLLPPGARREG